MSPVGGLEESVLLPIEGVQAGGEPAQRRGVPCVKPSFTD